MFFQESTSVSLEGARCYKHPGMENFRDLLTSVAASCLKLELIGSPSCPMHLRSFLRAWYKEWTNAINFSFDMLGSTRQSREPRKIESSRIFRASLIKWGRYLPFGGLSTPCILQSLLDALHFKGFLAKIHDSCAS